MGEDLEELWNMFAEGRKHRDELHDQFKKLLAEPTTQIPKVGDTVVVAVGLLNMGHPWIRRAGKVLVAGDTSYKIHFEKQYKHEREKTIIWVHQTLITDVVPVNPKKTKRVK